MTQPIPALLIATANPHKVREIGQILAALGAPAGSAEFVLRSAADFPAIAPPKETGATFLDNALIKARFWAEATGLLTLADDSGIVVEALGGRPGVLSARYAPNSEEANARLLRELEGLPPERRAAQYECVIALADAAGATALARGVLRGRIALAPRGEGGFGYDPIFELTEGERTGPTAAEIGAEAKNAISHRGRALAAIAPRVFAALRAGRVVN